MAIAVSFVKLFKSIPDFSNIFHIFLSKGMIFDTSFVESVEVSSDFSGVFFEFGLGLN
jgi:hypothetical protein